MEDGIMIDKSKHPCFNFKAKHEYARIHLPVAPKCNIQCNYCSRKYDCANESRPGVTSKVLTPFQAKEYTMRMLEKAPNISVVGIAGPGDAFANAEETLETLHLIQQERPDLMFCISTNGVGVEPYIDDIAKMNVSHLTLTINSTKEETLTEIYSWVRYKQKMYRGRAAGEVMKEVQLSVLKELAQKDLTIKVNSLLLPGVNEQELEGLAKIVSDAGAEMMNIIPLKPVAGTVFENLAEPSAEEVKTALKQISTHIQPMTHCNRCRADAAGTIGNDIEERHQIMQEVSMLQPNDADKRPYVAVASHEGMLVNQHLGEADSLYVFEKTDEGYVVVEERKTPSPGAGNGRWTQLGDMLADCRAILVGGCGPSPTSILKKSGIVVVQMTGLITAGLDSVYNGTELRTLKKEDMFKCGSECRGNATGCA